MAVGQRIRNTRDLIRLRPQPDEVILSRGRSLFVATIDGLIVDRPAHGFFVHETRLLSRWQYAIDDSPPHPNAASPVQQNRWTGFYVTTPPGVPAPERDDGSGQVPDESRQTLELRVNRALSDGLHEDVDLTNYSSQATAFVFAIDMAADFSDQTETESRRQSGTLEARVDLDMKAITFDYSARREQIVLRRSVEIRVERSTTPARIDEKRISFDVTLAPGEQWHACIKLSARIDGVAHDAPMSCYGAGADADVRDFVERSTQFETAYSGTLTEHVIATLDQAKEDLAALRLYELDDRGGGWTIAAGVPLYVALFGRDTLTTGWQAGLLGPQIMSGTLSTLATLQGTTDDPWRDEQPGKMLHEAHTGPLAFLGFNPRGRSYSSITTSGLYAFIAAELWHWTGDKNLIRRFIEPALRALQWLERDGDPDGDGFYEYQTRSSMAPVHQGWKDSPDAIVYEDGAPVEAPIATCEEQAFVYVAKLHLSETLWSLGEHDLSRKLYREAAELKKRFNEKFWLEDEGFIALALDAKKQPIRSIASNAGHCIAAAILDADLVERTTARLFAPDLFSGWGIRTLSADHPRYNPYSYHLGSVWPVEQATFALGFWRYGLHDRVQQLARAQFEAASLFEYHRLPELFGGHARDEKNPFPGIYPNANPLQAWSSSAVFTHLQALLGLYPYAPLNLLILDPHLPEWLPEITLRDLQVGKSRVSLHFERGKEGRTSYRVVSRSGPLHIVRQPTPWSLTAQPAERLFDALESLVPHRRLRRRRT